MPRKRKSNKILSYTILKKNNYNKNVTSVGVSVCVTVTNSRKVFAPHETYTNKRENANKNKIINK